MATTQPEKKARTDAVVGELIRDGEGSPGAVKTPIAASAARMLGAWLFAVLVLAATTASIGVCLAGLLKLGPFSDARAVLVAVLVLWPLVLLAMGGALGLAPRAVLRGRGQLMRWRLFRPLALAQIFLVPVLGQVVALVLGIATLLEKDPDSRRARRPTAIAQVCVAIGWPGMVVSALYALAPLFASEVRIGGLRGQTTSVDIDVAAHLEPLMSLILVYGSAGALWLIATVTALALVRHQRARARQAVETMNGTQVLEAGETVVQGRVDLARGFDHAVRVEVDQEGTEGESSGSWSHTWTEVDRRVVVAPFYLVHPSGERIRVEPTREVHLMDDLDGVILVDLTRRKRYAELIPGEQVIATGTLGTELDPEAGGGGYRGGGRSWVLRPTEGAAMLLSTHPLDAPFRRRARTFAVMAAVLTVFALAAHLLLLPYHLRVWTGETVTATVTNRHVTASTDDEGSVSHHFHVVASIAEPPLLLVQEVGRGAFDSLVEGSLVPVLLVAAHPASSQLGAVPRANAVVAWIFAVLISLAILAFIGGAEWSTAWYDEQKLVETASGRLPRAPSDHDGASASTS
jgi:hypothetical protein